MILIFLITNRNKKQVKESANPASHEQTASKLTQQGKPMLASIHRKIAMALRRGDSTSAKAITQELKQKKSSMNENFEDLLKQIKGSGNE